MRGLVIIPLLGALLACLADIGTASAQQPLRVRQDGAIMTISGTCDASAAVAVPGTDPTSWLVANDETESLLVVAPDGSAARPVGGDLEPLLRSDDQMLLELRPSQDSGRGVVRRGEADMEGAAWLGDRLYLITSHGRNSASGARRPRRERIVALSVAARLGGVTLNHDEGMTRYPHLLRDLAQLSLLGTAVDTSDVPRSDLAPEIRGLNIEGLAAGPDGNSLLIGLRNPRAPDGRAILLPLLNPVELRPDPNGTRARFGEPILLDLAGRSIRSIERVPDRGIYLIVAGPSGDGRDFALYSWAGPGGADPTRLAGDAVILGEASDPFRPEGLAVDRQGGRILLISDDGDRMIGQEKCKDIRPRGRGRFRAMHLLLE